MCLNFCSLCVVLEKLGCGLNCGERIVFFVVFEKSGELLGVVICCINEVMLVVVVLMEDVGCVM